jgi:valyl-tRNA synthetase
VVDAGAERKRLEGDLRKARAERDKFAQKLQTPSFAEKAPAEVVEKTRRLLKEYDHKVAELEASLARLLS